MKGKSKERSEKESSSAKAKLFERERKKKEKERLRALYEIKPNPKAKKISDNPLTQDVGKKKLSFPLKGVSKLSDNYEIKYLHSQSSQAARKRLIKLLKDPKNLTNPFVDFPRDSGRNIFHDAFENNDSELLKVNFVSNFRFSINLRKRLEGALEQGKIF